MLKVFEAFAGYGSQRMALRNLGIEHEVVAISEFDKFADASYQAIHGETWNMGDITKIDVDDVPDHDLFTYSFPCQDISVAGKGKGFSKDDGTRSGLLWESERIIKAKKPKYLLMENVKNLISEKFMPGFVEWILALEELGYSNYYEVLNAKDFGIPQNRERVFMVSILGEHEPYVFPKPIKLEKRLKDVLEDEVDEKYYLDNERAQQLVATITNGNEIGYVPYKKGGKQHQSNTVYDKEKVAPTIAASDYKNAKQILEPEIKQVLQYNSKNRENTQRFRTYDPSGVAPTLNAMQGGGLEPHIPEPNFVVGSTQKNASVTDGSYSPTLTSSMGTGGGHVPMIDEPKIAASRGRGKNNEQQLEVNKDDTSNALTTVEKDNYVVEPNNDDVKPINPLKGKTNNGWHFEQEVYDDKGIARALKAGGGSGNIPKTIERQPLGTLATGASEQFGVGYMEGLSKTLKANKHDISVLEGIPIINNTKKGYLMATDGDGIDLAYAKQGKRRGRVQKDMAQTLTTDDSKSVVELTAKEKFGRMGEQAVRTQNKLRLPHGETLNPWNEEQSSTNGISPTLTTRPEGFKTAINVTDQYRIRKLTPLECFRLMDVTDEDFYKAQAVNSNSQLYKQAGNSIVVSVLEAIFRNMFLEVPEEDLIGEHIPLF